MSSGAVEKAQRKSRTPSLDLATVEAVLRLRTELRAVKTISSEWLGEKSETQTEAVRKRLWDARKRRDTARVDLERLLEEDA